jgi:hypothetical protein
MGNFDRGKETLKSDQTLPEHAYPSQVEKNERRKQ